MLYNNDVPLWNFDACRFRFQVSSFHIISSDSMHMEADAQWNELEPIYATRAD